ncbi:uncharacterized protein LOC123550782 [Mercenaria mercenaria]|uniref:uncharacterized protein LOC123550782 n=1 Tax=Mercenaria mercenaria TaxID=6596 RepID=UPI00234E8766|nr:uncharacterized protein LOC123550782 [Mercenaria mercenaria]
MEIKMVPHWKKSKELRAYLDKMGFSRNRVQERKLMYERNSSIRYTDIGDTEQILAGSLREGVGFLFYNDIDILDVDHNIICETNITEEHVEGKTVLQIDENHASPGYCFLKIVSVSETSTGRNASWIKQCKKDLPLSSKYFNSIHAASISSEIEICPVQGPSAPIKLNITNYFGLSDSFWSHINFKSDIVTAFPCKVDHILHEWKDRKRRDWPDSKTISEIMTLPTYVVPVGEKDKLYEWRISFVMAELLLVHSFNDTQTKVYVLMKIVTKRILKPLCEDITSYVVKNVMFWLCEKVPKSSCQNFSCIGLEML